MMMDGDDDGETTGVNTFGSSAIAGFFAAFFSLPFDYVKTQVKCMTIQNVYCH